MLTFFILQLILEILRNIFKGKKNWINSSRMIKHTATITIRTAAILYVTILSNYSVDNTQKNKNNNINQKFSKLILSFKDGFRNYGLKSLSISWYLKYLPSNWKYFIRLSLKILFFPKWILIFDLHLFETILHFQKLHKAVHGWYQ